MTRLSLANPIAILMVCIGVVVFSVVVTQRFAVDTFPELTPPVLVVGTLAPGLSPKDMEKTISWRIEKYVSATPGVDHVQSISRNNLSVVFVWMKWGTDLNAAQTLAMEQVAFAMAAVPKSLGVLPPFVLQYDPSNAPVVQVAVYGGGLTGPQLYDYAFNEIEPLIEGIPGVAQAAIDGGRLRQINVVVDPVKAQARKITAEDVAEAARQSNALLPSGEFIAPDFDSNLYTNAIARRVKDIGDAMVKVESRKPVRIRDVAKVEDGGTPPTQSVNVNGQDAVYLNVMRIPGGNTLQIVDAVKDVVGHLKNLPPGVKVVPIFDQSTFVKNAYHGLKQEVFSALVLIALVILVFLQSFRGTLIVSVAIPLSFAVTLLVLYATHQTLNAFTLGGLTLAMGRLVDDAVVVLESIHRHQKKGLSSYQAALQGANAVALPVLASTLTTMAVLLPVVLFEGLAKKLFVPLALTVAVAMTASYFVSMGVTPVACRFLMAHVEPGRLAKKVGRGIERLAERYSELLRYVLPYRWTIIVACVVMVAGSAMAATFLPSTFFPEIDESMEWISVRLAPGTSIDDAREKLGHMVNVLNEELPKGTVELSLTNVGMPQNARAAITSPNNGPHMGFIRLQLAPPEERALSQHEVADRIRDILNRRFPGVQTLEWPGGLVASVFANGFMAPIVVEIRAESLEGLEDRAHAVADVARTVGGVADVYPTFEMDYPEIHVDIDRQSAGMVGVSAREAAQATLESTIGNINTPGVWVDGSNGQSYYVVTYYDTNQVPDPGVMANIPVRISDQGRAVTLGAYGGIRRDVGPVVVERNRLQRAAHVFLQTENRDIGSTVAELETKLRSDPRTKDIPFSFVGQVELMRKTFSGLGLAIGLAIMVVFMIMASQFKSLRLPFVMLFTIPVTLVGIDLALMAAGQGFSITALMGILMVVGIAVSNGILLVDHANVRFNQGLSAIDAVVDAAKTRFTPIVMTSLATVIGLVPNALALETGAEANRPLALAVVGGLTSSTFLSLFLCPVMFMLFAKRSEQELPDTAGTQAMALHPS